MESVVSRNPDHRFFGTNGVRWSQGDSYQPGKQSRPVTPLLKAPDKAAQRHLQRLPGPFRFLMRGLVRTILTTNFDASLSDALKARQPHIGDGSRSQPPPVITTSSTSSINVSSSGCTDALSNIRTRTPPAKSAFPIPRITVQASARRRADHSHRLSRSRAIDHGRHLCTEQRRVARLPHGIHIRVHT